MHRYEVVVGNIGTVYSGTNGFTANTEFQAYVGKSRRGEGRAANEQVTLFKDGDVHREYIPPQDYEVQQG